MGASASLGANRLIQRGEAKLILSAADVLEEFRHLFPGRVRLQPPLEEGETRQRLESRSPEPQTEEKEAKEAEDKSAGRAYISLSDDPEAFTDDERDILLVIQRKSLTVDDISDQTQIPARRVLSALTMLQLRGMVEERPGKRFYAAIILTA